MENYLVERDLQGISRRGFKVAFVMPQMNGEQFDPIEQVVNKRIGKQAYTFLLVRDYEEQDELLTFIPEFSASFARLSNTGEADMLKVMPNGQIIDANLMPLCHIKKISDYEKTKLQSIIRHKLDGVENFYFTCVDNEQADGMQIYYQKKRESIYLSKTEREPYRNRRALRSMRIFYDGIMREFEDSFYLNNNIEFCDELGGPVAVTPLFTKCKREAIQNREQKRFAESMFAYEDFDKIVCPEGCKVLAIKEATNNSSFVYIPKIVEKSFCHVHAYDFGVKVQPTMIDDKEVIAIFCNEKSYNFMNNWVNFIASNLMESAHYKKDSAVFYHRDATGKVLPITHAHICKADACVIPSSKKLQSTLENKIGDGFDIEIKRDENGDYDCYTVISETNTRTSKALRKTLECKHDAVCEAIKMFGEDAIVAQENDGSVIGLDKPAEMSR